VIRDRDYEVASNLDIRNWDPWFRWHLLTNESSFELDMLRNAIRHHDRNGDLGIRDLDYEFASNLDIRDWDPWFRWHSCQTRFQSSFELDMLRNAIRRHDRNGDPGIRDLHYEFASNLDIRDWDPWFRWHSCQTRFQSSFELDMLKNAIRRHDRNGDLGIRDLDYEFASNLDIRDWDPWFWWHSCQTRFQSSFELFRWHSCQTRFPSSFELYMLRNAIRRHDRNGDLGIRF
jgi:3-phenylpropionate/cinnamic acid dioxygenase small subunit